MDTTIKITSLHLVVGIITGIISKVIFSTCCAIIMYLGAKKILTYQRLSTLLFLSSSPAYITAEGRCAFTATAAFLPVFDSGCRLIWEP